MKKHYPGIAVINPASGEPYNPADWAKVDNPEQAEWLLIIPEYGPRFLLSKRELGDDLTFLQAIERASEEGGTTGTRRQWLDIYDAIEGPERLNKVLRLIGGDEIEWKWYWTSETFQSGSGSAWVFSGTSGNLSTGNARFIAYAARLFRASEI